MNIENAVALVTGSNRGLGLAIVNALLSDGAKKVYATGRDVNAPRGAARRCREECWPRS